MQNMFNFLTLIFWFSFILFLTNLNNFIKLLFYSELIWVIFYCYILFLGSINDDLNLMSSSFFILGFAGLEFSIGILIILIFKNINNNNDLFKNNYFSKLNKNFEKNKILY